LRATLLAVPLLAPADALWLEPKWLKIRRLRLGDRKPTHRVVHFTDVHYVGDRAYLAEVVRKINAQSPDFVCFTGDLLEEARQLPEALELLAGVKSPLYGVPGNHDYWSDASFDTIAKWFATTGGAWLLDQQKVTADGQFTVIGATCNNTAKPALSPNPTTRNILLMHYPAWVKHLGAQKYDLLLAGHSHGGQVCIPFYGPVYVPYGVDEYSRGLFQTSCGPLYVNPGIGWFPWAIRFNCRPEITVLEL